MYHWTSDIKLLFNTSQCVLYSKKQTYDEYTEKNKQDNYLWVDN